MHTWVGGNPGEGRLLDRAVAIAAIDPLVAHVVLVAELDRLLARGRWPR